MNFIKIIFFIFLIFITFDNWQLYAGPMDPDIEQLNYLLHLARTTPEQKLPKQYIVREDEFLFCTGDDKLSNLNNQGAELIKNGQYNKAIALFKKGLKRAPLFYPYHYNISIAYYRLKDVQRSFFHLKKASYIVPEYFLTYLQIGKVHQIIAETDMALVNFKKSIKLNPKYLDSFILIGNVYYERNQLNAAEKYYDAALQIDPQFINGQIGKCKILFKKKKYFQSYLILKVLDVKDNYDKSYHFFYAETAFNLQLYDVAFKQYENLLKFKNDKFFITQSINLIKHKKELAERFSRELKETEK